MALFSKDLVAVAEAEARKAADAYTAANARLADRQKELQAAKRVVVGEDSAQAALRQVAGGRAVEAATLEVEQVKRAMQDATESLADARAKRTAEANANSALVDGAIKNIEAARAALDEAVADSATLLASLADNRVRSLLEADPTEGRRDRLRALLGDRLPIVARRLFDSETPLPLRPEGPREGDRKVVLDADGPRNGRTVVYRGGEWVDDNDGGTAPAGRRVR